MYKHRCVFLYSTDHYRKQLFGVCGARICVGQITTRIMAVLYVSAMLYAIHLLITTE